MICLLRHKSVLQARNQSIHSKFRSELKFLWATFTLLIFLLSQWSVSTETAERQRIFRFPLAIMLGTITWNVTCHFTCIRTVKRYQILIQSNFIFFGYIYGKMKIRRIQFTQHLVQLSDVTSITYNLLLSCKIKSSLSRYFMHFEPLMTWNNGKTQNLFIAWISIWNFSMGI